MNFNLIVKDKKGIENFIKLNSMLYPGDKTTIKQFYEKDNITNILDYVEKKLSLIDMKESQFFIIIERMIILYNLIGDYEKSNLLTTQKWKIPNLLEEVTNDGELDFIFEYRNLFLNYLVAKYEDGEFMEVDYSNFREIIFNLSINKVDIIKPDEIQKTLIEIYIKSVGQKNIPEYIKNHLILFLPSFFLDGTSLSKTQSKEEYANKINAIFVKYFESDDFDKLHKTLKLALHFTYELMNFSSDKENKISDYPFQIAKSLQKDFNLYDDLSLVKLLNVSMKVLIQQMKEDVNQNKNAMKQFFIILEEVGRLDDLKDLLIESYFNNKQVLTLLNYIFDFEMYQEFNLIYKRWLPNNIKKLVSEDLALEYAYTLDFLGESEEAKKIYSELINEGKESAAAYNNLATIFLNELNLYKAMELLKQGKEIDSNNKNLNENLKRIQIVVEEVKEGIKEGLKERPLKRKND